MVQIGKYICGDIRIGTPPQQTQAELMTKSLTAEQAAKVYELAQMSICPNAVPMTTATTAGSYSAVSDVAGAVRCSQRVALILVESP